MHLGDFSQFPGLVFQESIAEEISSADGPQYFRRFGFAGRVKFDEVKTL
jgi:hypothetical protein